MTKRKKLKKGMRRRLEQLVDKVGADEAIALVSNFIGGLGGKKGGDGASAEPTDDEPAAPTAEPAPIYPPVPSYAPPEPAYPPPPQH